MDDLREELIAELQKWCDEGRTDNASVILSVRYVKRIITALTALQSREDVVRECLQGILQRAQVATNPEDPMQPPSWQSIAAEVHKLLEPK